MIGPGSLLRSRGARPTRSRSSTGGSTWVIWRGHGHLAQPLGWPLSGRLRTGTDLCLPMSGHQPGDDVPPPPPETKDRFPGVICDFGHGHAEHCRRIEQRGISWRQPVSGGFDEFCCHQLLAGSTDGCRDQVQSARGVGTLTAVPTLAGLECSQPRADSRQQVTGGIGTGRPRPGDDLFPETRDGIDEELIEVAPRTVGTIDASGQGDDGSLPVKVRSGETPRSPVVKPRRRSRCRRRSGVKPVAGPQHQVKPATSSTDPGNRDKGEPSLSQRGEGQGRCLRSWSGRR